MEDGSSVIALFNVTKKKQTISANLDTLGLSGGYRVRDLWRQKDLANAHGTLSTEVESHGVALFRLWKRN